VDSEISVLVTKDSGAEGGIVEKSSAAALCGVQVVVIKRPERIGGDVYFDIDEIIKRPVKFLMGKLIFVTGGAAAGKAGSPKISLQGGKMFST
jgi:hypothetical protein